MTILRPEKAKNLLTHRASEYENPLRQLQQQQQKRQIQKTKQCVLLLDTTHLQSAYFAVSVFSADAAILLADFHELSMK